MTFFHVVFAFFLASVALMYALVHSPSCSPASLDGMPSDDLSMRYEVP
jgi:hypothetical protein